MVWFCIRCCFVLLCCFVFADDELLVPLFIHVPLMLFAEDGNEAHDQRNRKEKDVRTRRTVRHHICPLVPARGKDRQDRYTKGQSQWQPDQQLPECSFFGIAMLRPVFHKPLFIRSKHAQK